MRTLLAVTLIGIAASCHAAEDAQSALPRSTPEEQGVSSAAILDFVLAADKSVNSMHSFMLVRHGKVVSAGWWTPYAPETRHQLYSLSKSFTSTAVGLAIAEKKLSLNDEVLKFFPDDAPSNPSANLKSMRVRDLLRMNTGQQTEPARTDKEPWTKSFLAHPVPFKPGTHFLYNTTGTYMLSAIVQKATGQTVLDYLRPRLFEPLGIEDPTWEMSPQGIATGGYGLSVRTEDIAKFGQLYLSQGKWGGKQLVPAGWVREATARQTSNGSNPKSDWDQGYGYQFWRCRHGAYRGDGAFGQYCIVLPRQDAVLAITSGTGDMQRVLNLVWDKLLPGIKPRALAADDEARKKLAATLEHLTLPPQEGSGAPAAGALGKKFVFPDNPRKLESITLAAANGGEATTITARVAGAEYKITCPRGAWAKGRYVSTMTHAEQPVAASGAWTDADTFTAKICYVETPFTVTFELKMKDGSLHASGRSNVGFGGNRLPELVGKPE